MQIKWYPVSQDPNNYRDAPTEGIRRVLEKVLGKSLPRGEKLNTDKIGTPNYGSRETGAFDESCGGVKTISDFQPQ